MKAVILAGGEGTRLRPITEKRPKPLIPLIDKTCIEYVIGSLTRAGFTEVITASGYLGEQIAKKLGDGGHYGATILHSIENTPAGTAGSVKKLERFLDDTFVVASGDVLADVDINEIYQFHKSKNALATIALTEVEDPSEFGITQLNDDGKIVRFKEKPKKEEAFSNLINSGIYVLEPEVLEYVPPNQKFDFSRDLFPKLLEMGKPLYGKKISGMWIDIGRPSDLIEATLKLMAKDEERKRFKNVKLALSVFLKDVYLYENVTVGARTGVVDSVVMANTAIGDRCEIKESVVCENCTIEDDVKIIESVIADDTTVKKGTSIIKNKPQ